MCIHYTGFTLINPINGGIDKKGAYAKSLLKMLDIVSTFIP